MFYVIDYNNQDLFIRPYADGATELVGLLDGYTRLQVASETDLDAVDKDLLLRIANTMCPPAEEPWSALPPEPSSVVWGLLQEVKEDKHSGTPAESVKPKREKRKKITKKSSASPLEGSQESATPSAPEGAVPPDATKEATVAKSKKSVKKSAKGKAKKASAKSAKASNGMPREGSKKAKLLAAVTKPGGSTMKQLIALTGWKACRGTLGQVVEAAGKKLNLDKETGRYTAK